MKKIAVTTWCTDDYIDYIGLDELRNSFKYFHPDVDFFVFDTKKTNEAMVKDPWLNNVWMMPPSCMPYIDDYDMVVHIDGDCVVTGPMTELFESDEDIIGVRNNNSLDKASSHPGITILHLPPFGNGEKIPIQGFINAGLIASNNKQFWYDWHELNREAKRIKDQINPYAHGIGDEQDTLNQIFHSGKYTTKIIDAMGTNVSYGLCNTWGENNNHWQSWSDIYVKDNALYIDDPKTGDPMHIKVMHQAGGDLAAKLNREHGGLREWMKTVIPKKPLQYINKVTSGMTNLLSFSDIAGNILDFSLSDNYKNHAFAEHSCVVHILKQFNSDFYWFLKENEDLNMIDLGANIGLFSMFVAPICEKIYAVEPTPSHFALMQELIDLAEIKNIEMLNLAVGTEDGEAEFNIHERNSTMNSFVSHRTDPHSGKTVKVKTKTLNSIIDSLDIDRVGFVKMDIEGFENEIIFEESFEEAMTKIDGLYVEVHDFQERGMMAENFNKISDKLKSFGKTVDKLEFDSMLVY